MKKFLLTTLCLLLALLMTPLTALAEYPVFEPVELTRGADYVIPEGGNYAPLQENFGELCYHDESIDVKMHRTRVYDTNIVICYVQIANPLQLRTEQARRYPSQATLKPSKMAQRVNAITCINADWFVFHTAGVVYRNGKLLRDRPMAEYDGLFIDMNGDFHIVSPLTREGVDAIGQPIWQSFCFGPALIINGEMTNNYVPGWPASIEPDHYKQRSAIGQIGPLQYVMVVTDGIEQEDSRGFTIEDMANVMRDLGAYNAYNLDGGASSALLLSTSKVNGKRASAMRDVGDIIYFTTAIGE